LIRVPVAVLFAERVVISSILKTVENVPTISETFATVAFAASHTAVFPTGGAENAITNVSVLPFLPRSKCGVALLSFGHSILGILPLHLIGWCPEYRVEVPWMVISKSSFSHVWCSEEV
jgi:hypothetical protein